MGGMAWVGECPACGTGGDPMGQDLTAKVEALAREVQEIQEAQTEIWRHLGRIWYPEQDGEVARGWDVALGVAAAILVREGREAPPEVREAFARVARRLRAMRTVEAR